MAIAARSGGAPESEKPDRPPPRLFQATGVRATPKVDWVEVQVKSVLNQVHGMPFRWSINPYRGCAHACVYCADGDTPVLMADGTRRPLGELDVGDEIYGTVRDRIYRHYTKTRVLAHWSVKKPAYRIRLEDGTELIASGDHRFLTERGWKFVTGTELGPLRRPHLTTGNKLMGVGAFAAPAVKGDDYRRGYLSGIIRGDGLLASYSYSRAGRASGDVHQFRLALIDQEPLRRAQQYLQGFAVPTFNFVFQRASATTKPLHAIRTSARGHVADIRRIIAWPSMPSQQWRAGFLAGIFDAEGSYSCGVTRISNTDVTIIDWITRSLLALGFVSVVEPGNRDRNRPVHVVRVPGGLGTHLRFFHTVDPAISRKRDLAGQSLKSRQRLGVIGIESAGVRELYDITTGTGDFIANGVVSHNCFARVTHWYLDQDGVNDWSSRIFVKVNAPEVLRHELARPSWKREQVHIGTATDPYQPAEGAYHITQQILEALGEANTPIALVTKSTMLLRDLDLFRRLASGPGAFVLFSMTTVDPVLAKEIEPDVPPPQRRLEVMRTFAEAGIPVGVILAPVLPGITDDDSHLTAVVEAAKAYGARSVSTNALYLGNVTRQAFFQYLEEKRPALIPEYERLYRGKYAPRAYQQRVQDVVAAIKRRVGFPTTRSAGLRPPASAPSSPTPVQLRLI